MIELSIQKRRDAVQAARRKSASAQRSSVAVPLEAVVSNKHSTMLLSISYFQLQSAPRRTQRARKPSAHALVCRNT
jgi:hypothetical protein